MALCLSLGVALSGCGGTRACKSGTVFVTVDFDGDALAADQVAVDVQTEGQAPLHNSFAHAPGSARGSIEVDFPAGYPAGRQVQIALTVQRSGAPVGAATGSVMLANGCSTLEIRVGGGGDAGQGDGAGDSPGAGGSGAGGIAGTTGGAGGGIAGGAGGTGATGGLSGGTDGGIDAGDAADGAAGGRIGQGVEDCFNGIDDDGNGQIDCGDSACGASATCVPVAGSTGFAAGAWVDPSETCPTRFDGGELAINATLNPGAGCTGCSCVATISCSTNLYKYASALACTLDLTPNGGTLAGSISAALTTGSQPTASCLFSSFTATTEARVGPYVAASSACTPRGTPALAPPTWGSSRKFCGTRTIGAGCAPGYVCVARAAPNHCVIAPGAKACPTGYTRDGGPWYTAFTESRSCSACACGAQIAGSCAGVRVGFYLGATSLCNTAIHSVGAANTADCGISSDCGSAGFTGTPVAPVCPATSAASGTLTPTGEQTLCCL